MRRPGTPCSGTSTRREGFGDAGYQKPEKIAIKLNMNQDRPRDWKPDAGMPSPQVVYSLVQQLIKTAGVPGSAITIYDATRYIGDPIYNKIRGNPDPEFQSVTFVVSPKNAGNGRIAAVHDTANPLHTKAGTLYLPTCVTEAKYMINMALLRAHTLCGVTLCAKNHFGSTYFPDNGGWTPQPLHDTSSRNLAMGSYNCLVDLNGHKHMDGKTLLYMIDALYPSKNQTSGVIRFASFGNDWFSSLLASQDMVAIDSVGLDFLRAEQAVGPIGRGRGGQSRQLPARGRLGGQAAFRHAIRSGRRREDPGEHGRPRALEQPIREESTRATWEQAKASSWCSRICREATRPRKSRNHQPWRTSLPCREPNILSQRRGSRPTYVSMAHAKPVHCVTMAMPTVTQTCLSCVHVTSRKSAYSKTWLRGVPCPRTSLAWPAPYMSMPYVSIAGGVRPVRWQDCRQSDNVRSA